MKRIVRVLLIVIAVLLLMVVALTAVAFYKGVIGRPVRWEIPAGYRGWMVIRYEDISCPPLQVRGIYFVIPVTSSGHGCTASSIPLGWRYHRYEYVHPDGRRTRAEVHPISYNPIKKRELIFVGTETELKTNYGAAPWW